jgi:hypothetical protein
MGKVIERATDPATSGTTLASAGKLNPEQADKFIQTMVEQSQNVLGRVTVDRMNLHTKYMDRISVGTRLLYAAAEGVAPAAMEVPTTARRTLVTKKVGLAFDFTTEFIEDNLEREGGRETLMSMLATQFANDVADLAINGDEGSGTPFLAINDGWVDIIKASAVGGTGCQRFDTNASTDYKGVVFPGLRALVAAKYRDRLATDGWEFWVPPSIREGYLNQIASRVGDFADRALVDGQQNLRWDGIPVIAQGYLPDAHVLLVKPKNLHVGILRAMKVNMFYNQDKDQYEVRIYSRLDFELDTPEVNLIGYDF